MDRGFLRSVRIQRADDDRDVVTITARVGNDLIVVYVVERESAQSLQRSMFAAQFALGMAAAAYLDGNPWRIIPACLIIGMSGPIGLSALKRLISIGGGK